MYFYHLVGSGLGSIDWHLGAPSPISGAVPHSAKADDVYEGFKIPRGSIIMMNVGL